MRAERVLAAVAGACLALTLLTPPSPAAAYETADLLIYLDASDPTSAPSSGPTWTDLSGAGRHGTLFGPVTYDPVQQAVVFPGGVNGTAYVSLATTGAPFDDFSGGFTIEFEAEFGATRTNWERIFDFAYGLGATSDAFWVGQYEGTNELAIEVWSAGAQLGYCHTATGGTALGSVGSRTFQRWMVTIGTDPDRTCRIYRDGVAMATRVTPAPFIAPGNIAAAGADTDGSAFSLPPLSQRFSAFVGRSNFTGDADLEGAIRYLRVYDRALTAEEAAENAAKTLTFDANDGSDRTATQTSATPTTLTPVMFTRTGHTFAGWNTASDGTGTAYGDGDTHPFAPDGPSRLFAQWTADPGPEPGSTPVAARLGVACEPAPVAPGSTVTCTVSGADPGIDLLWRAGAEPDATEGAVRSGVDGGGTFAFTVPAGAATGDVLGVQLVGWGVATTVTVGDGGTGGGGTTGPRPTTVRAGDGTSSLDAPADATLPLLLAAVAGLAVAASPRMRGAGPSGPARTPRGRRSRGR